jgi:predicted transposase YdaD
MRQRRQPDESQPHKPFDVTTKQLVEADPTAWLEYVGLPPDEAEMDDADLSTIVPEADKILRVMASPPYLLNLEFQSSYEEDLPERGLLYHVVARRRERMQVKLAIILLRPEADGPAMTGRLHEESRAGEEDFGLDFRYRVIRVWQQPVETVLTGPLATLPLAPLTDEAKPKLPEIIARMQSRIREESPPGLRKDLWAGTFLLMGLRYEAALIERLLEGVRGMEESTTYQLLISRGEARGRIEGRVEGREEEARNVLRKLGQARFGKPTRKVQTTLTKASLDQLEQMIDRLLQVETWQELIAQ